jgi:catechol 2,3-dioxygenase-like lactoylglutathione lyase family enzyme
MSGHMSRQPRAGRGGRILVMMVAAVAVVAGGTLGITGTRGTTIAHAAQHAEIMPILDHIHLNVPDQAKGVQWYQKNFGGQPMTEAPDRLMFGDTRLIFLKNDKGQPSTGSALDHLGFSVADLDAKMKEFEAEGVKIATPARDVPGLFKLAFVEDPWGTRIEVVQDSDKLGLHHVHLRAPDPAVVLAWYKEKFGGETAKLKDRIDGLKYSGVWILAQRGDATPSEGHAVDHIGWRTNDLAAKTAELKGQGVTFTTEPRPLKLASGTIVNFAYLAGPAGAKIELVQR